MTRREELAAIALAEADDTFQSITDLDSICDTTLIAVTFLLAAIATWTAFAFGRLASTTWVQYLFAFAVVSTVVIVALSVNQLIRALFPRAFAGQAVGERFASGRLLNWRQEAPDTDFQWFEQVTQKQDESNLEIELEEWLDDYAPSEVDDIDSYQFARMFNYKTVARRKAHHTARGLAWFRVSLIAFLLVVVLGLTGTLVL